MFKLPDTQQEIPDCKDVTIKYSEFLVIYYKAIDVINSSNLICMKGLTKTDQKGRKYHVATLVLIVSLVFCDQP